MKIKFNGEFEELPGDIISVDAIVSYKKIDIEGLVVAVGGDLVMNKDWTIKILKDGDTVEFIKFAGGG